MPLRGWKAVRSWNELLLDPSTRKTDCVPSPRLINSQIFKSSNVPCFNITETPRGCVFSPVIACQCQPSNQGCLGSPTLWVFLLQRADSLCPASSACCLSSWQSFPIPKRSHQKWSNRNRNPYPILFFKSPCAFPALLQRTIGNFVFFSMTFWMLIFPTKIHPLRPPTTLMDRCASYAKQLNPWRLEAQNLQQNPGFSWCILAFSIFFLAMSCRSSWWKVTVPCKASN